LEIVVALSYGLAILPIDIGFVFGLSGSSAGQLVVTIFPALFYILIVDNPRVNHFLVINKRLNVNSESNDDVTFLSLSFSQLIVREKFSYKRSSLFVFCSFVFRKTEMTLFSNNNKSLVII
jgi:hypothetical protein